MLQLIDNDWFTIYKLFTYLFKLSYHAFLCKTEHAIDLFIVN